MLKVWISLGSFRIMLLGLFETRYVCHKDLISRVNHFQYLYKYSCYKWWENKNYPNHKNSMKLQTEFKDVHCSKVILTIFPGRKWCLSYLVSIFHLDIDFLNTVISSSFSSFGSWLRFLFAIKELQWKHEAIWARLAWPCRLKAVKSAPSSGSWI